MKKWTLFLDRDGVINERIVGGYVRKWAEFNFLDGVLEALPILARKFDCIVVVTNQQGIAKGVMTDEDLNRIHANMLEEVTINGGRIDKIYYCSEHERDNPICRKPNIGMALEAQFDFPKIDFEYAIMVGDSVSDIEFGYRMKMKTVLIETKMDIDIVTLKKIEDKIDYKFSSLSLFANHIDQYIIV